MKIEGSDPVLPDCLDLFNLPGTQTGIQNVSWVELDLHPSFQHTPLSNFQFQGQDRNTLI
jgi:hypothetical protein